MFVEIYAGASLAFLIGREIYHRLQDDPVKKSPEREVQIPRVDAGAPVPLIYGKTRVKAPLLVAHAAPIYDAPNYEMNMLFWVGLGMDDGNGTNRVHNMWAGDWKLSWTDNVPTMTGDGGPEGQVIVIGTGRAGEQLGTGLLEFLNGKPTQVVAQDGATSADAVTWLGRHMLRPHNLPAGDPNTGGFGQTVEQIPHYRRYVSVFLHGINSGDQWRYSSQGPNIPAYSFEVSSFRDGGGYPATGIYAVIGADCNPANALWDLLKAKAGRLGLPTSLLDLASFQSAGYKLYTENHGYSRCIENAGEADEIIQEILRQIDGVLRINDEGKVELKLIRNDYDPSTISHITRDNCKKLTNFVSSGWTDIPNKLRVVYTNRSKDYQDDHVDDENPASSTWLDDKSPLVLQYPGVCYESLAKSIANREINARSRPIMKFRAIVSRDFLRVSVGDAVKVTWTSPDIAGLVFRVAQVERGTLENGMIALDLIQDYFYVWENEAPELPAGDVGIDLGGGGVVNG